MNTRDALADRLREHYAAKVGELRLPPLDLDDLLERHEVRLRARVAPVLPRRGAAWLVAAALVVGAILGAGTILVVRDDRSTRPTSVPQTAPAGPPPVAAGFCPNEPEAADLESFDLPNDVRIPGVPLPVETPSGYCAIDHQVTTTPTIEHYTVWSSCQACERPTASIARIEYTADFFVEGDLPYDEVDVGRYTGRFYGPNSDTPVSRLHVDLGGAPSTVFVGWGLDRDQFTELAAAALDAEAAPDAIGDMVLVFDGALGDYLPGSVPVPATISVWYFDDVGGGLGYKVYQSPTSEPPYVPPLEAYAWARPDPVFGDVNGLRTVSFPASAWFAEQDQSVVIVEIDDSTQVLWDSTGNPPVTGAELAVIPLTPAPADDPRWLEIAYESGGYDAVG